MNSASIIPYPSRAAIGNKLLTRDKVAVCRWEAELSEFTRIVIHDDVDLGSEHVDLVLVYGGDSPWARWGLARRGSMVTLWQCSNGVELGLFDTMPDALAALDRHAAKPPEAARPRSRRQPPHSAPCIALRAAQTCQAGD